MRSCLEKNLTYLPPRTELDLTPYYAGNRLSRLHRAIPSAFLDKKIKELVQMYAFSLISQTVAFNGLTEP
jgi:hypothetical protein